VGLLGAAAVLSGCKPATGQSATAAGGAKPPTAVGVVTLKSESQTLTTELPGRTNAFQNAEIRPQVSGIVKQRLFTEGALVKAGQPLYQIDAATYEVAEAAARATLAKAQAAARTAELNAQRNAELVKIDAVSRQTADESQALVQQTRADVASAEAALAQARINVQYTKILAPIAGRVGLSAITAGALVTANQTGVLTTIVQTDPIYVDVTQSTTELLQLRRDLEAGRYERAGDGSARVRIVLEDGSAYRLPGKLQFSGVNVNTGTGAITLRAVVPNPDGILMPGMYVRARLDTGVVPDALLLPQQGLTRDGGGRASVLVVTAEDKVERRPVEAVAAVGNRWRIASGLKEGERVVVDGLQRVRPGDSVKATEIDPATLGGGKRGGGKPAGAAGSGGGAAGAAAPAGGDKPAGDKPAAQGSGAPAPAAR
jgi:membrane fusion protein (multidrug efflux system)